MDAFSVLQFGLPDLLTSLVGLASVVVILMILVAIGGFVYKSMTGGVEWPEDREEDEDSLQRGDRDDEWDYY